MAAALATLLLLLVLAAAGASKGATTDGSAAAGDGLANASSHAADGDCPAWLAAYTAFHAKARQDPAAKYLIWTCNLKHRPGRSRYVLGSNCNGLGDRLRGIMWMVRVAAGSGRVLLAMERHPAPLETYLEPPPGGIDWRTSPELEAFTLDVANVADVRHTHSIYKNTSADHWKLLNGSLLAGGAWSERIVTMKSISAWWQDAGPGAPNATTSGPDGRCLFAALFRPTSAVLKVAAELLQSAGVGLGAPYAAAHVRLGGLIGEDFPIRRYNDSGEALRAAAWCVEELGRSRGLRISAAAPALLLTDNVKEREAIAAGRYGAHVATPPNKPIHFHSRPTAKENLAAEKRAHMATVAEMFLLANASCLVSCRSGFSEVALVWGCPACHMHLGECLERHAALLGPPPPAAALAVETRGTERRVQEQQLAASGIVALAGG